MKIGITERGDAGRDLSWKDRCLAGEVDAAILVSKSITPEMERACDELESAGFPFVVHATCTGWGATKLEPGAPPARQQLDAALRMLDKYGTERVVLRIDPILPTAKGIARAMAVAAAWPQEGRIRFSILDQYSHTETRFAQRGLELPYPPGQFQASRNQMIGLATAMAISGRTFESCAEAKFAEIATELGAKVVRSGCVSPRDVTAIGLDTNQLAGDVNKQHRNGCLCIGEKTELLTNKKPCPNGCAYCYWCDR